MNAVVPKPRHSFRRHASALEMPGQAALEPGPEMTQGLDDGEIEDRRPEISLVVESAGEGIAGFAHQVEHRDNGDDRRALDQKDDLVAVRAKCDDESLRQNDLAEGDELVDAESGGRLVLAMSAKAVMLGTLENDVATSIAVLDRLPPAERGDLLDRLSRGNYRFVLGPGLPGVPDTSSKGAEISGKIEEAIGHRFPIRIERIPGDVNRLQAHLTLSDGSPLTIDVTPKGVMLEDLGHEVVEANSGSQALDLISSGQHFDLVISDYSMPGMTGAQLAQAARDIYPALPIVLATGYADLPSGTDIDLPRLAKPYNQAQLAKEIAKAMARETAPLPRSGGGDAGGSKPRLSKANDVSDEIGDGACVV